MMLKSTEKLIRCAAAQAPVIDWSMYGEQTVTLLWRHFLILRVGVMCLTRLLEMRTRSGFSVANQSCCVRICWSSQVKFIYVVPIHNKSNHKRFVISVEKQSEVWSTLHKPGRISLMLSNNNILISSSFCVLGAIPRLAFDWREQIPSESICRSACFQSLFISQTASFPAARCIKYKKVMKQQWNP